MAAIAGTHTLISPNSEAANTIAWEQINQDDTGAAVVIGAPIRHGTISFQGTWDSMTQTLEGTLDGSLWVPLRDTGGAVIAATADTSHEFRTNVLQVRIAVSGGTTSDVDVNIAYLL